MMTTNKTRNCHFCQRPLSPSLNCYSCLIDDLKEQIESSILESSPHRMEAFHYRGDKELGETWMFTALNKHRDSGPLDISNREVFIEMIRTEFPHLKENEDWEIFTASHWAYGWIEHLIIKAKDDKGEITPLAAFAIKTETYLKEEYPILNDEHFSRTEYEAAHEVFINCYAASPPYNFDSEKAEKLWEYMRENDGCFPEVQNDSVDISIDDELMAKGALTIGVECDNCEKPATDYSVDGCDVSFVCPECRP